MGSGVLMRRTWRGHPREDDEGALPPPAQRPELVGVLGKVHTRAVEVARKDEALDL